MGYLCKTVEIGGHRGLGTTDNIFAKRRKSNHKKPAENTLDSFAAAFDAGADFIELDIIRTKDNVLVVTHSNRLIDHVVNDPAIGFLADMDYAQVQHLRTGPRSDLPIPKFTDVLKLVADYREKTGRPLWVNIEVKDVKGSGYPKLRKGHILDLLGVELEASGLPNEAFLISSFALSDLVYAAKILPSINRAQLFDAKEQPEHMIYLLDDGDDSLYAHYTPENIARSVGEAGIVAVHPEIRSTTDAAVEATAKAGLAVNSWGLFEKQPKNDRESIERYYTLAVREYGLKTGLITDHVSKMVKLIAEIEAR